jgi:DNA-directed RNA polymerase subunit M/transcription elongation factor TFIIS
MVSDVYIRKCPECATEVFGIMTSVFAENMTIVYECSRCGHIWSEDQKIGEQQKREGNN